MNTNSLIDSPGLVLASCRHGSQLRLFDMLPGLGERRIYAALLANELAKSNSSAKVHVMYDIACQFSAFAKQMAPESLGAAVFAVPAMHGYAHQFQCQVSYHCRFSKGFGLSDGENVERNWSEMDRLVPPLRTSTSTRRRHALCNFIRSAARRKRMTFGRTFTTRWKAAEACLLNAQRDLREIFTEQRPADSKARTMDEFILELRADLADRKIFYRETLAASPKRALDLEPIDLLFQVLTVQSAGETSAFASGVPLPYRPVVGTEPAAAPARLDYDELWRRWQNMESSTDPQYNEVLDDIYRANAWLRGILIYDRGMFETGLARKLSHQILILRRKIWLKWSDNMERNKRLRAAKTGEKGSSMILKSMLRASQALRSLIDEHNRIIEQHIQDVPNQPCHRSLEHAMLGKEVESPGFLLMPATMHRHRWMKMGTRAAAMEQLSRIDRANEESALLMAEATRLYVFYTSRCSTLISVMASSQTPEPLLLQAAFLESRSFRSFICAMRKIPILSSRLDIGSSDQLIKNLTLRLKSFAPHSANFTSNYNDSDISDTDLDGTGDIMEDESMDLAMEEQLVEMMDAVPDQVDDI